jgi:hypothetical protein
MTFFRLLYKAVRRITFCVLILVALYEFYALYSLYAALPRLQRIPLTDDLWNSSEYVEQFHSRERYRLVETFVREEYVYWNEMRPEYEADEKAFKERALGLYWGHMAVESREKGENYTLEVAVDIIMLVTFTSTHSTTYKS